MNQFQRFLFCLLHFHFNTVLPSTPRFSSRSRSIRLSVRISVLLRARRMSRSSLPWFCHPDVTGSPLLTLRPAQILVTTKSTSVGPRRINVFFFFFFFFCRQRASYTSARLAEVLTNYYGNKCSLFRCFLIRGYSLRNITPIWNYDFLSVVS